MSLKNEQKIEVVKAGSRIQIALPSLCNYDDDDEDDEEAEEQPKSTLKNLHVEKAPSVEKKVEKPRSGLLGLLPPPKSAQNPFVSSKKTPTVVDTKKSSEPMAAPAAAVKTKTSQFLLPRTLMNKREQCDEEESESKSKKLKSYLDYEDEDPEPCFENDEAEEETVTNKEEIKGAAAASSVTLNDDAMLRLCGSQSKKQKMGEIKFTDVSADQIVGDNKSDLLKQITSEYKPPSNKDYFASSSRRTHQITYLAKVAVERDQELRNTWAQSKFNKKMSREKYGF
jgi:hypothetical protein